MDDFIFVTQKGRSVEDSKGRQLVRAHVSRKYWQRVKTREPTFVVRLAEPQTRAHCRYDAESSSKGPHEHSVNALTHVTNEQPRAPHALCMPRASIGRASDIFVYAGVSLPPRSYQLFQHYAAEFKVVMCNSVQPFYIGGLSVCCTTAVQTNSAALLHAICFHAAAHEAVEATTLPVRRQMFRDPDCANGFEWNALHHKAQALANLRDLVESRDTALAATESSVLCIAILLGAEAMLGDITSVQSHAHGLKLLVAACGGIEALSTPAARVVRFAAVKATHILRLSPEVEMQSLLVKGPHDTVGSARSTGLMPHNSPMPNYGLAFFRNPLKDQFHPSLISCIAVTRRLALSISQTEKRLPLLGATIDHFIFLESSLVLLRDQSDLSIIERCVCLALLLFVNTALWRVPLIFNWIKQLSEDLKEAVLQLDRMTLIHYCPDLLLWFTVLGRYSTCGSSGIECKWWSDGIRNITTETNIRTIAEVKNSLQYFFYSDEVYDLGLNSIWYKEVYSELYVDGAASAHIDSTSFMAKEHPCDQKL